jgi:HEAT repeat protein
VNEPTQDPGKAAPKGFRPFYLFGFLALAGVAALLAIVILHGKSNPQTETVPGTNRAVPLLTAAQSNAIPQPGAGTRVGESGDASLEQLIRILKDASRPLSERQSAILALARNGSREALAALGEALRHSPSDIRRSIAAALAECPSPDGLAMLLGLVKDADQSVARAAVQALAQQDQPQAATALAQLVNDTGASTEVRCEAVAALGAIREPWILEPLSRAAKESHNENIMDAALDAIAGLDFSVTKDFFKDFLQSPDVTSEMRVTAIEALGGAQGDPTSFLADLAAHSPDADIRVAAAMAMSATEVTGNAGPELLAMLANEADPDVRLRLYQALRNQESFDVAAALADVQKESDPSARIAGFDLLAKALRENPTPELKNFFDQTAIPELKQMALNGPTQDDRQAAIIALARAHTPEAMAALSEVGKQITEQQKTAEAQAASQTKPKSSSPNPASPRRARPQTTP